MPLRNYDPGEESVFRRARRDVDDLAARYRQLHDAMDAYYPDWWSTIATSPARRAEYSETWREQIMRAQYDAGVPATRNSLQRMLEREEAVPDDMRADYERLARISFELHRQMQEIGRIRNWAEETAGMSVYEDYATPMGSYRGLFSSGRRGEDNEQEPVLSTEFMDSHVVNPFSSALDTFDRVMRYIWGDDELADLPLTDPQDTGRERSLLGAFDGSAGDHLYYLLRGMGIQPASFVEFAQELRDAGLQRRMEERNYNEAFMEIGVWDPADMTAVLDAAERLRGPLENAGLRSREEREAEAPLAGAGWQEANAAGEALRAATRDAVDARRRLRYAHMRRASAVNRRAGAAEMQELTDRLRSALTTSYRADDYERVTSQRYNQLSAAVSQSLRPTQASGFVIDQLRYMPQNVRNVLIANFDRTFDKYFDQDRLRREGRSALDDIYVNGHNMGAVMDARYAELSSDAENLAKMEVMFRILSGEPVDIAMSSPDGTVRMVPLRVDAYNQELRDRLTQVREREQELRGQIDTFSEVVDYQSQPAAVRRPQGRRILDTGALDGGLPSDYEAKLTVRDAYGEPDEARIRQMIELSALGGDKLNDQLRDAGTVYFDEMMQNLPLDNLRKKSLGQGLTLYEEMGYRFPAEAFYVDGRPIADIVAEKYGAALAAGTASGDIKKAENYEKYVKAELAAALLSGQHHVDAAQPRVDANGNYEIDVCSVEADLHPLDGYEGLFRSRRSKLAEDRRRKDRDRHERSDKVRQEAGSRLVRAVNRALTRQRPYREAEEKLDLNADITEQYFTEDELDDMRLVADLGQGAIALRRLPAELQRSHFQGISRLATLKLMKDHPEVRLADLADPDKFAAEKKAAGAAVWNALTDAMAGRDYDALAGIMRDSMETVIGLDYGKELRYALNLPEDLAWADLDREMRRPENLPMVSAVMKGISDFGISSGQVLKKMNAGSRFIGMKYGINPSETEMTDPATRDKVPTVYGRLSEMVTPDRVMEFDRKLSEMDAFLAERQWLKERQGGLSGVNTDDSAEDKYTAIARRLIMERNRRILLSGNGESKEVAMSSKEMVENLRDRLMKREQALRSLDGLKGPVEAKDVGRYLLKDAKYIDSSGQEHPLDPTLENLDQGIHLIPGDMADTLVSETFLYMAEQERQSTRQMTGERLHGLSGITEGERNAAIAGFVPGLLADEEQYNSLLRIYMMAEKDMSFEQAVNVNAEVKAQITREFQEKLAMKPYDGQPRQPAAGDRPADPMALFTPNPADPAYYYGDMFRKAEEKMAQYDLGAVDPNNPFAVVRSAEAMEAVSRTVKDMTAMKARASADLAFDRGYTLDGGPYGSSRAKGLVIMGNYADHMLALANGINDDEVRTALKTDIQMNKNLFKLSGNTADSLARRLTREQLDRGAADLKGLMTDLSRTRRPINELAGSEPAARREGHDMVRSDVRQRQNVPNPPVM